MILHSNLLPFGICISLLEYHISWMIWRQAFMSLTLTLIFKSQRLYIQRTYICTCILHHYIILSISLTFSACHLGPINWFGTNNNQYSFLSTSLFVDCQSKKLIQGRTMNANINVTNQQSPQTSDKVSITK